MKDKLDQDAACSVLCRASCIQLDPFLKIYKQVRAINNAPEVLSRWSKPRDSLRCMYSTSDNAKV